MQLKVRIKVGSIFKVPVCKGRYDIAPPEQKIQKEREGQTKLSTFLVERNK